MKKNYLLSAAAAFLLAVTGCSDDIENGGNSGGEGDGNNAYMTVHISTVADGVMTKAYPDDPEYPNDNGSGWGEDGNGWLGELPGKNEGMVHDINIFLFSTTETQTSLTSANHLDFFNTTDDADKVNVDGHGWLSLGTAVDASTGGNEPNHGSRNVKITMKEDLGENEQNYQVFAIVNAGRSLDAIATLSALRDYMEEEANKAVIKSNETNVATADKFVMSTHKMISHATPANLPSIVTLSARNTEENPAQTSVYVERLAARVDLAYPTDGMLTIAETSTSPIKNQGDFYLTGYMLINQWQGQTNMFKQVSPSVNKYTEELAENSSYNATDPKKYLGDEKWIWTTTKQEPGTYNFVLSKDFWEKKTDATTLAKSEWTTLYKNHFGTNLNDVNLVQSLPASGVLYEENTRTYYPVAYVRENTLNTKAQVNGYTTGMIFRTQFTPNDQFVMNKYDDGSIKTEGLTQTEKNTKKFVFLTAEHYDGKEAHKLVYRDIRTVAARAFNIPEGDTKGLLKGFMESWASSSATLDDIKDAVSKMSEKNLLSKRFKDYLNGKLKDANTLTDVLKGDLIYTKFIDTQSVAEQAVLNMTDLSNITTDQIGLLAQSYGVSFFRDGQSYHKFWIRHDDNLDDYTMGVMEFAIVRNNVYQLYVRGIRGLGDPLPYTPGKDDPGTPDENNEITINVTIYVKDWVKRTNKDIVI